MSNEKQETVDDIVREMRDLGNLDRKSTDRIPRSLMGLGLQTYADRIEEAAKRVYAAVDYAVANIEDASSDEITSVRRALEKTIGDYYE